MPMHSNSNADPPAAIASAPAVPVLSAHGLAKRYHAQKPLVLGPVDFELAGGEILGIRGENGAGKSTLLSMLAGVLRPSGGEIRYGEGVRERIAYVPQELSLYESLSGNENLRFWGMAMGLPGAAIRLRSQWLLEMLGLSGKGRERVAEYSGGMKRRLHLATALLRSPALLLLDEPTVGADEPSRRLIFDMLFRMRAQGAGIVLVSHLAQELETLSDRILVLREGRLEGVCVSSRDLQV